MLPGARANRPIASVLVVVPSHLEMTPPQPPTLRPTRTAAFPPISRATFSSSDECRFPVAGAPTSSLLAV